MVILRHLGQIWSFIFKQIINTNSKKIKENNFSIYMTFLLETKNKRSYLIMKRSMTTREVKVTLIFQKLNLNPILSMPFYTDAKLFKILYKQFRLANVKMFRMQNHTNSINPP